MQNGHYAFYYNRFEPNLNYNDINVVTVQAKEHMEDCIHLYISEPHRYYEFVLKNVEATGYKRQSSDAPVAPVELTGDTLPSEAEFDNEEENVNLFDIIPADRIYSDFYDIPEVLVTLSQMTALFAEAGFRTTPGNLMYFNEEPTTPEDIADQME